MAIQVVGQETNENQGDYKRNYLEELKSIGNTFAGNFYPNYTKFYALPEKQFVVKIDSVRRKFNAVLNKFKPALTPDFVKEQGLEIKYYFDKLLIDYPLNHDIYAGKTSKKKSSIPEKLKGNLTDLNKPELLGNSDFVNYVKSFFSYKTNIELKNPIYRNLDNQHLNAVWKLIPQFISNPKCQDFWQAEYLFNHIDNNGIKNIRNLYEDFKSACKDSNLLKKVTDIYSEDFDGRQGHLIKTYKTVGAFDLDMHIFLPDSFMNGHKKPVLIYFHGGSWSEGKPDWFFSAGESWAKKGWIACAVEYRILGRHGTLPFEAVMDARSAIRWLRKNAKEYNLDPDRIVASGNSAGGHLVLCTALAGNWNEKTDDLSFSPVPNILMINAGVYDLTDPITAWIRKDLKDKNLVKEISPSYLTGKNLPPTLIIHGTDDPNVPYTTAQKFVQEATKVGNTAVEFHSLEKAGHFIWYDPKYTQDILKIRSDFLTKYGY
ncbi:MAG: alpha/beta hydrolase [Niabella sp.]